MLNRFDYYCCQPVSVGIN